MSMSTKDLRLKFGVTMQPIPATRVFVREMPFDHTTVKTRSWILINDNARTLPDGKPCGGSRCHINTYGDGMGKGANSGTSTFDLGDEKTLRKKLKGYVACNDASLGYVDLPGNLPPRDGVGGDNAMDVGRCPVSIKIPLLDIPAGQAPEVVTIPAEKPQERVVAADPLVGEETEDDLDEDDEDDEEEEEDEDEDAENLDDEDAEDLDEEEEEEEDEDDDE